LIEAFHFLLEARPPCLSNSFGRSSLTPPLSAAREACGASASSIIVLVGSVRRRSRKQALYKKARNHSTSVARQGQTALRTLDEDTLLRYEETPPQGATDDSH